MNYSEGALTPWGPVGILYWLDGSPKLESVAARFEEECGALVYHALLSHTSMGRMLALLYVSRDEGEWGMDRADLAEGRLCAYVRNLGDPQLSECGGIAFAVAAGGPARDSALARPAPSHAFHGAGDTYRIPLLRHGKRGKPPVPLGRPGEGDFRPLPQTPAPEALAAPGPSQLGGRTFDPEPNRPPLNLNVIGSPADMRLAAGNAAFEEGFDGVCSKYRALS